MLEINNKFNGQRIGYARVSTGSQTLYQYHDMLEAARCDIVFVDAGISALVPNRPGLRQARKALREGDTFVVPAIDRAFRSTIEGITFLDEIHQCGMSFESLYQRIDTRTPEGRKWFIDSVSYAEYERAMISRRTREKMAAAKRRGVHLGRKKKLSDGEVRAAYEALQDSDVTLVEVARKRKVSTQTIRRAFKRLELVP